MNRTTMDLEGDCTIVITRTFNAPPRIVFDAWTRPELVERWWAPKSRGVSMASCEAEVKVGGRYRYVLDHGPEATFAFSGEYLEVTPPSRLVYTNYFEPTAGGVNEGDPALIITVTFEERDGKTFVMSREVAPSKDVRDIIIASGMESGMRETMDLLDELVATLR